MSEENMAMPSGMGGLVRYFDEYKSKIQMEPMHIVMLIVLFIVFEIVVRI